MKTTKPGQGDKRPVKPVEVINLNDDLRTEIDEILPHPGKALSFLLGQWESSVVIHDVNEVLFKLTAGYRRSLGHHVLKFAPNSVEDDGCHFNPLDTVRIGTVYEVKDAMNLARLIINPDHGDMLDFDSMGLRYSSNHWRRTSFMLLTSVILHVLYAMPDKTLRGVAAYLNDPTLESVDIAFERMMQTSHDIHDQYGWVDGNGMPTRVHPVIAQSAWEMLNKADNEKWSIISTMLSYLSIYRDPIVARWTEHSDFQISDLQDANYPVSLYVITDNEDGDRLKPLIRIVLRLLASRATSSDRVALENTQEVRQERTGLFFIKNVSESTSRVCQKGRPLLFMLRDYPGIERLDHFLESCPSPGTYLERLRHHPSLLSRSSLPWPKTSDEMPNARRDYAAILGVENGTLPIPIHGEVEQPFTLDAMDALDALLAQSSDETP